MDSLFPDQAPAARQAKAPLAERMRPRTFDEFVGQEALLAPGKPLREAIERDLLQSIILWGPPGTGKTTLARIIADTTKARFVSFSAVLAGIKEIREVMAEAERLRKTDRPPHHRLHRRDPPLQQGAAGRLPAARRGRRHRADRRDHREPVVRGQRGAALALEGVRAARAHRRRGRRRSCTARWPTPSAASAAEPVTIDDDALHAIALYANGDARSALNLLELSVASAPDRRRRTARGRRARRAGDPAARAALRQVAARSTTTSSRRCTSRCATATPTRRSTGSRGWWRPARIRCTSRAGSCASRRKTSATPIRRR